MRRRRSSGSFPSKGSALDDALEEAEGRVHDLPPGIAHAAVVQAQELHGARAGAAGPAGTKGIDKYLPQQALLYVDKTAAKKARLAARRSSRSLLLQPLSFRNRAVRRVANRAVLGSGNLSGGAGSNGDTVRV